MDLRIKRIKLLPWEGKSFISAPQSAGQVLGKVGRVLSWQALGAALLGIMLARWTWLLFAPAGAAMAPASWQASEESGLLFGKAAATTGSAATAAPANIKLIGVFANRTKGFAIMQVDNKQIGVAQGDDVSPGIRLEETHADYVVLNHGGVRQRVTLSATLAAASPNTTSANAASPAAPAPVTSRPPSQSMPAARSPRHAAMKQRIQQLRKRLHAKPDMPPQQKARIQQQIDHMMRGLR